jgi:hypothetical protein
MSDASGQTTERSTVLTALFAWILPGLGHWWIGQRGRAIIFFVVTTVTFWGGVAVGGVRSTVSSNENGAWIAAQLCMGPQALGALWLSNQYRMRTDEQRFRAAWPASNISVVYAGVAGMLNLLIIIDALSRSELAAMPVTVGGRERRRDT